MMNGNYLKYFYWTVKKNSSKKAGEICHKTQSAISQAIVKLELSLDTNLLIRYNNRFELTQEGKELYIFAEKFLNDFEVLQQKLQEPTVEKPVLRIGISENYLVKINRLINLFLQSSVSYEIQIEAWDGEVIRKKFAEGLYDLMIGIHFEAEDRIPSTSFEHISIHLFDDKIGLCAHKDHHELLQKSHPIENLLEYPMILSKHSKKALQTQLKNEANKLTSIVLTNHPKSIPDLLQGTDYISLLSRSSIPVEHQQNIVFFNEKSFSLSFPIAMNYRTESHFGCENARKDFLQFTRDNLHLFS
ncbi:LysR family transcriptional regulator [bacterium]|nr:LysR family transcriptional regulator [bacterium]